MFIKFCGFTRMEDIDAARKLPVSAIGFIFHKPSKRYVDPETARTMSRMLKDSGIKPVGVFVDGTPEEIMDIVRTSEVDIAQLYNPGTVSAIAGTFPIIRAFRIGGEENYTLPEPPDSGMVLFDTYSPEAHGGTGKSFNHELVRDYRFRDRMIIAGGLNENNIRETIHLLNPGGIDISSGIEISPGIKSEKKMLNILRLIEEANNELNA